MKNQYIADVNDYLKYALLRTVSDEPHPVVVAWMLTDDDERADGRRLDYLSHPARFRSIDPPLFDVLNNLLRTGQRTVAAVETAGLVPHALFVKDRLDDSIAARAHYMEAVLALAPPYALIFFDPDNGIETHSIPKGRRNSRKYVYWDELMSAYQAGHSLVVYQHFPRRPRTAFIRALAEGLEERTSCRVLMTLSTPHVAFLIFPQPSQTCDLQERLERFALRSQPFKTAVTSSSVTRRT